MDVSEINAPSICNENSIEFLNERKENYQNHEQDSEVIRFAHKVTVDNLNHYVEDAEWKNVKMCLSEFEVTDFLSYIELCPDENIQKNKHFSICNNFLLFENKNIQVNCKLSIIDGGEKCCFEKEECNEVELKGKYVWKCEVDTDCLGNYQNLEMIDKVVIWCEINIFPSFYKCNNKIWTIQESCQDIANSSYHSMSHSTNLKIIENYFNSKSRVIDSLAHKWTIDNFGYFYQDEWAIDGIESIKFYSNANQELQFNLILYPNGGRERFRNNLAIFLHHSSSDNVDVNVRYRISIVDINGEKAEIRGLQYTFNKKNENWGFGDYISVWNLLDHLNGLLKDDTLTLLCEVLVIGDGDIKEIDAISTEVSESHFNANLRVIYSLVHKWTIDNFENFYRDEGTVDYMESEEFYSSSDKNNQFHLRLYPNGIDDECINNLSICLIRSSPDNVKVIVRFKVSIIDKDGQQQRNTKSLTCTFKENVCGHEFEKYISISQLLDHSNGLLCDDRLTLLCEMQVIGNGDVDIKEIENTSTEISESHYDAKLLVIYSLAHKWTIDNFEYFYQDEWIIDEIESNNFNPNSNAQQQFVLFLYPNGFKHELRNNLSIYLDQCSPSNVDVNVRFKISIIDKNGKKQNTRCIQCTFNEKNKSYFLGFRKYICVSQLLDHSNGLLCDDTLTLLCEMQVIGDGECQFGDNTSTIAEVSKSYFNANPRVIDSLSHKWTIDTFGYLYRDEWIIDILKSNKFHSNSNYKHQFYLCLYPNGVTEECKNNLSIYLSHFLPDFVDVNVRCKISILDEKGEKLNTKCFRWKFNDELYTWGFFEYISVSQLLLNSNGLLLEDTLTLLCEVQVIADGDGLTPVEDLQNVQLQASQSYSNVQSIIKNQQNRKLITHKLKNFKLFKFFYSQKSVKTSSLEIILSKLISNNHLLVKFNQESSSRYDFSNATLKNVIFTCNSTSSMRDIIINDKTINLNEQEIEYIAKNFDPLIKASFNDLISTLGTHVPLRQVIKNEINKPSTSKQQKQLQHDQPEQPEQSDQPEQSEQSEQPEQPEQSEQSEQPEQPEQSEQSEQSEQPEQLQQAQQSQHTTTSTTIIVIQTEKLRSLRSETNATEPVSQFRPFLQHIYNQSNSPNSEFCNQIDQVIEQLLKIKNDAQHPDS